jgi:hypothetical protein
MVCRIPSELTEKSCHVLGELVGAPMLLTLGLRGTPSLCIFGSPYNLGGLEPAGHSYLHISFVRVDFLSSSMVFHSIDPVGSLARLLYDGSSRREVIFCL